MTIPMRPSASVTERRDRRCAVRFPLRVDRLLKSDWRAVVNQYFATWPRHRWKVIAVRRSSMRHHGYIDLRLRLVCIRVDWMAGTRTERQGLLISLVCYARRPGAGMNWRSLMLEVAMKARSLGDGRLARNVEKIVRRYASVPP